MMRSNLVELLHDVVRACIGGAAMTLVALMQARVYAAMFVGPDDLSFLETAMKQGGLFALMIIIMFFYRRDWAKLNSYQQNMNTQLMELVQQNVAVMTEVRDELRRQPDLMTQSSRSAFKG